MLQPAPRPGIAGLTCRNPPPILWQGWKIIVIARAEKKLGWKVRDPVPDPANLRLRPVADIVKSEQVEEIAGNAGRVVIQSVRRDPVIPIFIQVQIRYVE